MPNNRNFLKKILAAFRCEISPNGAKFHSKSINLVLQIRPTDSCQTRICYVPRPEVFIQEVAFDSNTGFLSNVTMSRKIDVFHTFWTLFHHTQ